MPRRTKIIATIGPASDAPATLEAMIEAGMDVARIGLAHGTLDEQMARYQRVRAASEAVGRAVGILVDLPGPKVRAAPFGDGSHEVILEEGSTVHLAPGATKSTAERVEVDYDQLL